MSAYVAPVFAFDHFRLTSHNTDTILHVTGANAREGIRLEIGHLVVRMPYLRVMRS
jgi:hypothetical protein